ncbi:hypothetical protein EDC04DRAFT_2909281 [Pisolithus marmoratus]|nr:hypothetical protein EDC04DRAFT_2909281 [Pisolithus marmoratus]
MTPNDDTDSVAPPNDPLLDTAHSECKTTSTYDINHYFEQEKDKLSVCRVCFNLHNKHPVEYMKQKKHAITYSSNTMTGILHGHIGRWHLLDFIDLVMEPGRAWPIQVSPVKEVLVLGYMLEELKAFLEKGVDLRSLPPQAIGDLSLEPTGDRVNVPPFSLPICHKFLINFIITDDQSLNIIKCKEFHCLLLLLREDLKDSDIPHHMRIWSNIIQAWKDYFTILKIDLAVHIS